MYGRQTAQLVVSVPTSCVVSSNITSAYFWVLDFIHSLLYHLSVAPSMPFRATFCCKHSRFLIGIFIFHHHLLEAFYNVRAPFFLFDNTIRKNNIYFQRPSGCNHPCFLYIYNYIISYVFYSILQEGSLKSRYRWLPFLKVHVHIKNTY